MARASDAFLNAGLAAMGARLNNGYLRVYSGTRPAGPGTALSGNTLLFELRFANPNAFGTPTSRVITANTIAGAAAAANGTASFARCFQSDGTTAEIDLSVGTSGAEVIVPNTTIASGVTQNVSSLTITAPTGT